MDLSIIVCTFNRAEMLQNSIDSIIHCELPEDLTAEIIVVDNNSSDDTEALIKGLINKDGFPMEVKYYFEKRPGKSCALNTGLEHAAGNHIAFTDDDIIVDSQWIKEIIKAFDRYPDYNCFGGRVLARFPSHVPPWFEINGNLKFLRSAFGNRDDGDIETEYGENTISSTPGGGNMFFRKGAIETNGLFRDDLGPIGNELGFSEDTEYCLRLIQKGEQFMYIPSALVYHIIPEERLEKPYLLHWQYKCGKSEVKRQGGYKNNPGFFNVPRYLLRKFLTHCTGWGLSIKSQPRFYHKLRLYYTAGEIMGHLRMSRN
jgi:glycosyltransferase involved in cell wall biosynthesis